MDTSLVSKNNIWSCAVHMNVTKGNFILCYLGQFSGQNVQWCGGNVSDFTSSVCSGSRAVEMRVEGSDIGKCCLAKY